MRAPSLRGVRGVRAPHVCGPPPWRHAQGGRVVNRQAWVRAGVGAIAAVHAVSLGSAVASAQTASPMPVQVTMIGPYDAGQAVDVVRMAVVLGFAVLIAFVAAIAIRGVRSR